MGSSSNQIHAAKEAIVAFVAWNSGSHLHMDK